MLFSSLALHSRWWLIAGFGFMCPVVEGAWRDVVSVPMVHFDDNVTAHVHFPYTDLTVCGHVGEQTGLPMQFTIQRSIVDGELIRNMVNILDDNHGDTVRAAIKKDPFALVATGLQGDTNRSIRFEAAVSKLCGFLKRRVNCILPSPKVALQHQIINTVILLEYAKSLRKRTEMPFLLSDDGAVKDSKVHVDLALRLAVILLDDVTCGTLDGFCAHVEQKVVMLTKSQAQLLTVPLREEGLTGEQLVECHQLFSKVNGISLVESSNELKAAVNAIVAFFKEKDLLDEIIEYDQLHIHYLIEWLNDSLESGYLTRAPPRLKLPTSDNAKVAHCNRTTLLSYWKELPQPKPDHQFGKIITSVVKCMFVRSVLRFMPALLDVFVDGVTVVEDDDEFDALLAKLELEFLTTNEITSTAPVLSIQETSSTESNDSKGNKKRKRRNSATTDGSKNEWKRRGRKRRKQRHDDSDSSFDEEQEKRKKSKREKRETRARKKRQNQDDTEDFEWPDIDINGEGEQITLQRQTPTLPRLRRYTASGAPIRGREAVADEEEVSMAVAVEEPASNSNVGKLSISSLLSSDNGLQKDVNMFDNFAQ